MWHANLLQEVLKPGSLLRCPGKDKLPLRHSLGIAGCIKFFIQDLNLQSKFGGFDVKFAEAGDLLSHPPVIKIFNLMLQVDEVATGPK